MKNKIVVVLVFLLLITTALTAQQTANEIMQKVMDVQKADSVAMDIRFSLIDAKGEERERRIQTLALTEGDLTSTITVFLSPASVRNTRFLTRERSDGGDDQWIFLPALGRVKRIASNEGGGSFMGSDFTYNDMSSTTYDTTEALHTLIGEELIDSRSAYKIVSVPYKQTGYVQTQIWVDKEFYLPLRVEFFEKDKTTVSKVLTTEKIEKVEDKWITKIVTMTTLATNHSTRVEILQAKYNAPMNSGYFTTKFLETGRP
ncbi:MAG: outer membrane lipoprotein-sorting protein [Sphaerochaetaceae bacterium]|jgi:outer membrane lipoprotein-sorting protein